MSLTALVVGAGPAGSLAALHAAKHNYLVKVFDKAPLEQAASSQPSVGSRSYNIITTKRGYNALEAAGIQMPDHTNVKVANFLSWRPGNKLRKQPTESWCRSINRGSMSGLLVQQGAQQPQIEYNFGYRFQEVDLAKKQATFVDSTGQVQQCSYDLLVGADGTSSQVRAALADQLQGTFTFSQLQDHMEYRTADVSLARVLPDSANSFVTFYNESRDATLLCTPSPSGIHRAVFIMPHGRHQQLDNSIAGYTKELHSSFDCFTEQECAEMAQQFVTSPVSTGGYNTRCSQLHGPSTILLGDAAHSMWPSLGQGANSALEDCKVLGDLLAAGTTVAELPAAYTAARHADALAAVDLTEAGFGGRNNRAMGKFFLFKLVASMLLRKLLPWLVPAPAFIGLNTTLTPYSEVARRVKVEDTCWRVVLLGLAAAAAYQCIRFVVGA